MRPFPILVALVLTTLPLHAQDLGDAAAGEKLFNKCSACHQIGEDAKNKAGPVLTGVIGRAAGSYEGFKYGASMLQAGDAGLVWTTDNIFDYIADPKAFLRSYLDDSKAKAKMSFRLKDEQDRADVIAYLATFQTVIAAPDNGFCVQNQSGLTHVFAVDAGGGNRHVQELAPGEILCTSESDTPQSGFVSVFETPEHTEGCSRLVSAGMTEGMLHYSDFDRCEWSSHTS